MSFEDLVNKYTMLVYKICVDFLRNAQSAEDAVQDTFLNLYKHRLKYIDLEQKELKNIICKIALNRCRDILKSKEYRLNNQRVAEEFTNYENYLDDNDIEIELFKKDKQNLVIKMINELKEPYRTIITKRYIDEETLGEMEENLNIPKATLKVQISRGKKLLRENIEKKGGIQNIV